MGIFDKLVMTDEEKEQTRQLNKIGYINALNTHNQELQQKVLMLTATNEELHKQAEMNGRLLIENAELRNSYNQAIDDAADLLNCVDLPRDELAAAIRKLKK